MNVKGNESKEIKSKWNVVVPVGAGKTLCLFMLVIPAFGSRKRLQTNVWKIKNTTERFFAQLQPSDLPVKSFA